MKKFVVILLTVLMVVSLAACGGEKKPAEERTSDTGNTTENFDGDVASTEKDSAEEMKILVAYFSATNTTEGVAEMIADSLPADIYEIVPEQPYTDDDLNYHDDNSRSTIEMNDSSARPAISGSVEDMEQYDIVFVGYPIWWGDAPRIVCTFMESYDFSGKTIVPFCTSGGSGVGSSATNLEALTDGATWLSGTRLNGGSSRETIVDWVNGLGLDLKAE
ncbi:MAG: flavodoxin [Acetatifactor sp.]|nr:flavodoxin [Acetatifactor sp.]